MIDSQSEFVNDAHLLFTRFNVTSDRAPSISEAISMISDETYNIVALVIRDYSLEDYQSHFNKLRGSTDSVVTACIDCSNPSEQFVKEFLIAGGDIILTGANKVLAYQMLALMRRYHKEKNMILTVSSEIKAAGIEILIPFRTVIINGVPVKLPNKEFDILCHLAQRPWVVVTYEELYTAVWGGPFEYIYREILWSHVNRLRCLLNGNCGYIKNHKRVGYSFEPRAACDDLIR